MQNLTILTIFYIVYGSSLVDANSEVSESEVNQFLALPASPSPLCLSSPLANASGDNC